MSTFNCPICEYKKIQNTYLSIGDFIEKRWIENYFSSLGLSFEKMPERKDEKTPDGYILHNQQRIALVEIKFLGCGEREKKLKQTNNTEEYLTVEIFNERLSNEIPQAKEQLKTINDFEGPKIIYFITETIPSSYEEISNIGDKLEYNSLDVGFIMPEWVK